MPWSDDTRCLYCDGKLPLYQKLTHGQFCSKAHQKKYWDEQQQLAVERLHQTHSDIQAYKPPEIVENLGPIGYSSEDDFAASILGPEAVTETPVVNEAYGNDSYDNEAYFTSSFASDSAAKSVVNNTVVDDYVDPPVAGFLQSALEPVGERPDFIADDLVGETMEPEPAVALPAWVASGTSDSTQGLWDLADHVLDSSIPEPASAQQAELAPWTSGPFCERYTAVHSLALSVAPLAGIVEPDSPFEFETAELVEVSSSALSEASQNGLATDASPNYAPALVRGLSSLTLLPVQPETASVMSSDVQADLSHTASGRPEIHISNGLASVADYQLMEASLCEIEASDASVSAPPVGSLPIGSLDDIGWQDIQRPSLVSLAIPVMGLSEDELQAIELANAPQPEPEPAVAPLPPEMIAGLSELPFNLDISSAPTWEPTTGRSLMPHVEAMLPVDSQVAVVPVVIAAAEPEAQPVAGPVDIPPQARHVAMQHVLVVSPANSPFKPSPALAVIPEPLEGQNILPRLRKVEIVKVELKRQMAPPAAETRVPVEAPGGIRGFWKKAPRDLKLLACAIPLVVGLAFHSLPKVSVSAAASDGEAPPSRFQQVLDQQFASIKSTVASRAAIALDEDFRGGIDKWISGTGATAEWGFDATGFVNPGPLALYEPSLKLNDYQMQFLGMIDQKAMSWVARAENFENYYVIKLVVLKEGPLPTIGLTRYAVIDGKPVDRVDVPVRIDARPDTIYRVRMEINGDRFSLDVQGRMVDTWEEPRLPRGGVGFFTGRGEKSSIRWVQLTHQYDVLGRLCAFLAPYEF